MDILELRENNGEPDRLDAEAIMVKSEERGIPAEEIRSSNERLAGYLRSRDY